MRRRILIAGLVAALLIPVAAVSGLAAGTEPRSSTDQRGHTHPASAEAGRLTPKQKEKLAPLIATARAATAKYATDLERAQADGYNMTITQMIPDMGHHFLNPSITDFDVTQPPILVYLRNGDDWQLGAFEWVFTERPEKKPLPGAKYGEFGAACHYEDGTFVFEEQETQCAATSPTSGAAFTFWHPDLVTLHLWLWYPNPDGIYAGTNPWVSLFNDGTI